MTATTPDTGLRAGVRRLTGAAAAFALALGIGGFAAPAMAADGDDTAADAGVVELYLSVGIHGRVAPGASTTATLSVQNDTDDELSAGRVFLELNRTPLTDGDAVTTWLDDSEAPGDFVEIGTDTADAVDAGDSDRVAIDVPAEALADLAPGVYPLRAGLSGATTGALASHDLIARNVGAASVLVVTSESVQVGVLVPVTATPADRVLLTADELTALTAPDGALTAALDGVTGTAAVLAIDPAIVAAIRVLGTAAPVTAKEWLARLDALPNERFALQFGDADATVQAQANLPALLEPTTLTPFLAPENFPAAPATPPATPSDISPTPSPTPVDADAPALPDDATLTAIEGAADGILWPLSGARAEDLSTFAAYLDGEVTTIVSSAAVGGARSAHATADAHDLLVMDDAVSATISDAASESDADARQPLLASASAQLFLAAQAAPVTPMLVGLDRDETRDPAALREAIAAVDSVGFDLTSVRAMAPAAVALADADVDTERVSVLESFLIDEGTMGSFATILEDPQVLLSRERIRVMRDIGVGVPSSQFAERVQAHRTATNDTLHAVSIPPSSTIQLLSASADLPFSVKNDLPWPVTLRLSVAPTDPRLEVERSTDVVVPANTSTRVKVPVSARVGSGEVGLRLDIYSPTGVLIDGPQTVRVAVRAEWETIGLVIFGSLAVLLIVGGVVRTVLRKRREAADETTDDDGADAGEKDAVEKDAVDAETDGPAPASSDD